MTKTIVLIAALFATATALADGKKPEAHLTPTDLAWAQPFGPKGPAFAFVVGKFGDKNPASFFVKMPAGSDSGWHTHDEDYSGVVIQGQFTVQQDGEAAETQLPSGSYYTQLGKKIHRNGCLKGSDCVVFVHFDKGANNTPVKK